MLENNVVSSIIGLVKADKTINLQQERVKSESIICYPHKL